MKTAFLCGPYSTILENKYHVNCEVYNIKKNIRTAIKAARFLRESGYNVFCPHVAIAGYCQDMDESNSKDHEKIMKMSLQWVSICDVFVTIPEWHKSENCKAEMAYATALDKLIIYLTYGQIGV